MSDMENRVGNLERDHAVTREQLRGLQADVSDIGAGVKQLLDREARRPDAVTMKSVAAAAGGITAIAVVVWFVIEISPAVRDIDGRLTQLDNPVTGRVPSIEKRTERVESRVDSMSGWRTSMDKVGD